MTWPEAIALIGVNIALIVVAGCWKNNAVAIWAGIIFMFLYDAKPEMEIISRTKVYQDCKFNIIDGENHK
mgnify:CR=1 FL=1